MRCEQVVRERAAFLALSLPTEGEAAVRAHLRVCSHCRKVFVAAEPALMFAVGAEPPVPALGDDESFVSGVMTGVRQRVLERRLGRRRPGWRTGMAAAILVMVAASSGRMLLRSPDPLAGSRSDRIAARGPEYPDSVLSEVEGDGVRYYQLTTDGEKALAMAFVVDPSIEL